MKKLQQVNMSFYMKELKFHIKVIILKILMK